MISCRREDVRDWDCGWADCEDPFVTGVFVVMEVEGVGGVGMVEGRENESVLPACGIRRAGRGVGGGGEDGV